MIEDVQRVVRFGVEVVGLPGQPVAQRDGQRVGVVVPEERYSDAAVLTLCQFDLHAASFAERSRVGNPASTSLWVTLSLTRRSTACSDETTRVAV
jgi:hypothetical protein